MNTARIGASGDEATVPRPGGTLCALMDRRFGLESELPRYLETIEV